MSLNARLFFASMFSARLGDQFLLFIVPLVVYQTTESVALSGLAYAVETLPRILCYPFCGILSDRVSPIRLIRITQLGRAAIAVLGLAGFALYPNPVWVVMISALCGVLASQGFMAREVMLPQIFATARFDRVQSLAQTVDQCSIIIGPLAAATIFGISNWQVVVGGAAVLFMLGEAAMMVWRRINTIELIEPEVTTTPFMAPLRVAFHHVMYLPGLRRLVILTAAINLVFGATLATSAAVVTGLFELPGNYYALLQTMGALATVSVLLLIAMTNIGIGRLGTIGYVMVIVGGIVTALSPNYWIYALGFVLILGFDGMYAVYIRTARQRMIPARDLGKTTGVVILFNSLSLPLSGLIVGLAASPAQTGWIILALSFVMVVAGLAMTVGARLRKPVVAA
ncbi:MFS transporter [Thalassospira profundimaris]|uniref:MFS transporter n=1 Tax=Thalassospira profundimaris TaxID=502049 RepID=A0A367XLF1_9PROT|nr:MFS transporter [Thalassospira profundimaris]RCK53621.1 MFS transporter [Thalassospira profundimaris]